LEENPQYGEELAAAEDLRRQLQERFRIEVSIPSQSEIQNRPKSDHKSLLELAAKLSVT
jgi:hypothetical protein